MSMQIYYFSGTGNSLHVAKELRKRFPEAVLVPIMSVLNSKNLKTQAETIGLVFPIHAFAMPYPVKQFLQQVDLKSASYIFAITSRFCSDKVFSDIDRILKYQKKSLDSYFSVELPCSYIQIFDIPSQDKIMEMESELQKRLDEIQSIVANKRINRKKDELLLYFLGHFLFPIFTFWYKRIGFSAIARSFYSETKCTGCGLCERVCLSGKIKMSNNKPEWLNDIKCTYCYACLHFCPVEAIQIKNRKTRLKERYHHSKISADDIANQK